MEANRAPDVPLRIAFCVYRGNPYSGGQGVYTKYLTEALSDLGHQVTVFSGPPYPDLDDRVRLVRVGSLDLYRESDPFRVPALAEFKSLFDLVEFALMSTGAFPEPRVFGYRAARAISAHRDDFDIIHDNQSLNWSLLKLAYQGMPMVASIHHPITVDRLLDFRAARGIKAKVGSFRWYGFVKHQCAVARRVDSILTVSQTSRRDMVSSMEVDPARIEVVPIGVDTTVFRPDSSRKRTKYQIVTTASADVPLKGLIFLIDALGLLQNSYQDVSLKIIGPRRPESEVHRRVRDLGLGDKVEFLGKISQAEIVELYASSHLACVPSLYEGFSLPAIEAMACGVPLVATDGGALPEVVGADESAGLIAKAGDAHSLAVAMARIFDDDALASSLSHHARLRVLALYSWKSAAIATVEAYRGAIAAANEDGGGRRLPIADHSESYLSDEAALRFVP